MENIFMILINPLYKREDRVITTTVDRGYDSYDQLSSRENKMVQSGARIELYPVVSATLNGSGGYVEGIPSITTKFGELIELSGLFDTELPKEVLVRAEFGECPSRTLEVKESLPKGQLYCQFWGGFTPEVFFSTSREVRLIPHERFNKYGFKKSILKIETSEGDECTLSALKDALK